MKKLFLGSLLVTAVVGVGCTSNVPSSDFTPPTGKAENPPRASAGERRLLTATSQDGVTFTPTGTVFTEQGNVPDAVVTDDGTVFVYYVGQGIEEGKETTPVAISRDHGKTWSYHLLEFTDWPTKKDPSDPDVVLLEDGTFRMYYTTTIAKNGKLGIAYANSTDGISFTYKGVALAADSTVIDSSTMYVDGMWHMFVLDEKLPQQYHATSQDGITFALVNELPTELPKSPYILSNPLIDGDTVRMFAFSLQNAEIRSFTTTDFTKWTDSKVAIKGTDAATLGSGYIQDSTVVQLADGSYLMVYVTQYPE